ncbi:MAG: DUF1003 domain-containing protein [Alphaproteobacteria bacterium]|nr:DUF1003 domain-containing protein [Alphaproteobacteria bacterium]
MTVTQTKNLNSAAQLTGARPVCAISGKVFPARSLQSLGSLRPSLIERVLRDHPDLPTDAMISTVELDKYRMRYVEDMLLAEHGELTDLDRQVAKSLAEHDTITENTEDFYDDHRSVGDRLADQMAKYGGSWYFLISFALFLALWMTFNSSLAAKWDFDPYPFIFLNLMLSCLAAVQAPVILMSQRRTEAKDRLRAQSDYRVNLKAELEIRHLHEKLDYLVSKQWERLMEIQQLQLETLQENRPRSLIKRKKRKTKKQVKSVAV